MKNPFRMLAFALLFIPIQSALAQQRFILRAPADSVPAIALRHSLTVGSLTDAHGITLVTISDVRTADQLIAEVSADPDVQGFESDAGVMVAETKTGIHLSQSTAAILDALKGRTPISYFGASVWNSYVNQPAAALIHINDAHEVATGWGIVAIIDTGVDPLQPALRNSLVAGYDFIHGTAGIASEYSDLDPNSAAILGQSTAAILDRNTVVQVNQSTAAILDQSTAAILDTSLLPAAFGHGTMVAGIIHLVAPNAQIMPLKAFNDDGSANLVDIVHAIYYAVDNGARVINMSFSLNSASLELMKALNYATSHGVVSVGSVGNSGLETMVFPAAFQNVIGVASTSILDAKSSFSNYGAAVVCLAAPGEDIVTTYPGGNYAVASGTSFAAPFVSGGASLVLQRKSSLGPDGVDDALSSGKKLGSELGHGRVDILQAVKAATNF